MTTVADLLKACEGLPLTTPVEISLDRKGSRTTPLASASLCNVLPAPEGRGLVLDDKKHEALLPKSERRLVLWPTRGHLVATAAKDGSGS